MAVEAPEAPTPVAADPAAPAAPERPSVADALKAMREKNAAPAPKEEVENPVEAPAAEGEAQEKEEVEGEGEGDDPPVEGADDPAEGGDEPEAKEEDESETKEGEPFSMALPARGAKQPEMEVTFDGLSKEEQEGLRRMKNGYMRGEQAKAELAKAETVRTQNKADRDELDEIEESIRTDPAGFVLGHISDRAARTQIALDHLVELLNDESDEAKTAYDGFIEQLQKLEENPVLRENHILKRTRAPKPKSEAKTPAPTSDPEVIKVVAAVRSYIPAGTDEAQATAFLEDSLRGLHRETVRLGLNKLTPKQVEQMTARYRQAYGFTKKPSAKAAADEPTDAEEPVTPARPVAPQDKAKAPLDTGKRLATASARRREAVSTPAGGGAPPVAPTPLPKGGGIKEALQSLRQNLKG